MAKDNGKKKTEDMKRSSYTKQLAFKWLEMNEPEVLELAREAAAKKYPKSTTTRSKVSLPSELMNYKGKKAS